MVFRELTIKEFDDFATKFNPATPYQTGAYGTTMSTENYYSYYVGLLDNNEVVAATFIMIKKDDSFKYGYSPRGILIDYTNKELLTQFSKELKKYLSKKDVVAIKINPMIVKNIYDSDYNLISTNPNFDTIFNNLKENGYNHLGYNSYFESFKPRFEAMIELNKDSYSMFENMSKPFRTKVRSAEANGVRIYKGHYDDVATLYSQAKNKYPRKQSYYENLYNNFDKMDDVEIYYAKLDVNVFLKKNQKDYLEQETLNNNLNVEVLNMKGKGHQKLLTKKLEADKTLGLFHERLVNSISLVSSSPNGIILSVVLVTKVKDTVNVMIDSYDKQYNRFNAKHLIIWKLMEKYGKEGYRYFNLGGMTNKVDKRNKYFGLNSYKLGFGSKVYEYIGDLEFVGNKPLYIMFRNTAPIFKKQN